MGILPHDRQSTVNDEEEHKFVADIHDFEHKQGFLTDNVNSSLETDSVMQKVERFSKADGIDCVRAIAKQKRLRIKSNLKVSKCGSKGSSK